MSRLWQHEPLSAALQRSAGALPHTEALRFTFQSRGDLVSGRALRPLGAERVPLALLSGPEGSARSPWFDAAARSWGSWLALASVDMPLCGSRSSEKLSKPALGSAGRLAEAFRSELEAQALNDLARALSVLRAEPWLEPEQIAFVGLGLGARLGVGFCREAGVRAAVLAWDSAPPPGLSTGLPADRARVEALSGLEPDEAWLAELGDFLRERLS
jgi:hypothetical protein